MSETLYFSFLGFFFFFFFFLLFKIKSHLLEFHTERLWADHDPPHADEGTDMKCDFSKVMEQSGPWPVLISPL